MKKIKKTVSLILVAALLGTAVMTLSSCGLFSKKIKGTEAAKILLARERLDENAVGAKSGILGERETESNGFFNLGGLFGAGNVAASVGVRNFPLTMKVSGIEVNDDSIVWSKLENFSGNVEQYSQFIDPIDEKAEETAETIAKIKESVGITEKWIRLGFFDYMLIVEESSETVIAYSSSQNRLKVSVRYTTDDAKCVYEMYDYTTSDSETTMSRDMCIPGEHYEHSFRHSNGYTDYFIADKSLGYWIMNRINMSNTANDDFAGFSIAAIKDGLGYGTNLDVSFQEDGKIMLPQGHSDLRASLFLPDENRDLFTISNPYSEDIYEISVYTSNIESGLDSIAAYGDAVNNIQQEKKNSYYVPETDNGLSLNLSNGKRLEQGYTEDGVTYTNAWVNSKTIDGDNFNHGYITFSVEADSCGGAIDAVTAFLNKNGITLRSDRSTVVAAYSHCELLYENFDITEWYGYRLDSKQNLLAAENALIDDFNKYESLYQKVKDYESADWTYDVAGSVKFEPIEITSKGNSTYSDGFLTVSGLEAKMDASDLLEEGTDYVLQIGLALQDADGSISGVNEVDLECSNTVSATYSGGSLVLSANGSYAIPEALSEGDYVVVAYFATADGGIRVTEMLPIAVLDAKEGKLDTSLMDVAVTKQGESLKVSYRISLAEYVKYDTVKESYTHKEIEKAVKRAALSKGYPLDGEAIYDENGQPIEEGKTYGGGEYRMKFLVNRDGKMVEAYIYCSFD